MGDFSEITLNNFQCHRSLSIPLGKITTLVGPSDSGKTTVLRAFDCVCFNLGRPVLIQRRGADHTSVSVTVDGHKITRSTQNNSYQIDQTLFKTIGRNIPPEVTNLLHISEDNIQRQHDYLFWFTASGSTLVSNLNRVVDLTKFEEWIRIGVQRERVFKEEVTYCTTRKSELEQNIVEFSVYRDVDVDLKEIEDGFIFLEQQNTRYKEISDILVQLGQIQVKEELFDRFILSLSSFIEFFDLVTAKKERLSRLEGLLASGKQTEQRLQQLSVLFGIEIDFDSFFSKQQKVEKLCRILVELEKDYTIYIPEQELERTYEVSKRYDELSDLLVVLRSVDEDIRDKVIEFEDLEQELHEKTGGLCPICGNVLGV